MEDELKKGEVSRLALAKSKQEFWGCGDDKTDDSGDLPIKLT